MCWLFHLTTYSANFPPNTVHSQLKKKCTNKKPCDRCVAKRCDCVTSSGVVHSWKKYIEEQEYMRTSSLANVWENEDSQERNEEHPHHNEAPVSRLLLPVQASHHHVISKWANELSAQASRSYQIPNSRSHSPRFHRTFPSIRSIVPCRKEKIPEFNSPQSTEIFPQTVFPHHCFQFRNEYFQHSNGGTASTVVLLMMESNPYVVQGNALGAHLFQSSILQQTGQSQLSVPSYCPLGAEAQQRDAFFIADLHRFITGLASFGRRFVQIGSKFYEEHVVIEQNLWHCTYFECAHWQDCVQFYDQNGGQIVELHATCKQSTISTHAARQLLLKLMNVVQSERMKREIEFQKQQMMASHG
mmetsp:Transcript_4428/g.16695  ORF Transcript_4428/g.16695 Transcript_4428/m.16695 type:complete len:357 (-) Transcript_4428:1313-2383(-)